MAIILDISPNNLDVLLKYFGGLNYYLLEQVNFHGGFN